MTEFYINEGDSAMSMLRNSRENKNTVTLVGRAQNDQPMVNHLKNNLEEILGASLKGKLVVFMDDQLSIIYESMRDSGVVKVVKNETQALLGSSFLSIWEENGEIYTATILPGSELLNKIELHDCIALHIVNDDNEVIYSTSPEDITEKVILFSDEYPYVSEMLFASDGS